MKNFDLKPIGRIQIRNGEISLEVNKELRAGLLELKGFSHVQILSWAHLISSQGSQDSLIEEKPYHDGPDKLGIFASRSPSRPNPILLSIAPLISVDEEEGVLRFAWVDLENETPVLDIKPYLPCADRVVNVSTPSWCQAWPSSYESSGEFDWSKVFNF